MSADRPTRDDDTDEHDFGPPPSQPDQPDAGLGGWQPPQQPGPWQAPTPPQPGQWQAPTPPPPSQWQAPAAQPGQWQAPAPGPYGGPGQWPANTPGWSTQMSYAQPEFGSSGAAVAGAIALIVMGALVGIFALLALLVGVAGESILELADPSLGDFGPGLMTAIVVIAIILLILAALHFAAGIGVLAHRTWARWLGIVIGALGLVFGVLMMLGGVGDRSLDATDWLIPLAWTGAYLLAIGGLAAGSRHFSQVNP